MKVRLLKPHTVNGHEHVPGSVIELSEASVRNLIEWGVGEPAETRSSERFNAFPQAPIEVPQTKANPDPLQ